MAAFASEADDYTTAIHRALALVQFAERGDAPSLQQSIAIVAGPRIHQPEVLADLRKEPPDLNDADQRLTALIQALEPRTDTPDPSAASQQLHAILTSSRYAGVANGPSLLDQAEAWLLQQIFGILSALGIQSQRIPLLFLVVAALVLLAILVWAIVSSPKGAARQAAARRGSPSARRSVDHFAEADRLANAGDYVAAIRSLAGGVAVAVSGERTWDHSPLTVREIFARASQPDQLRVLLLPFEAAIYGHRQPDAASYARAAEAAAPYRRLPA